MGINKIAFIHVPWSPQHSESTECLGSLCTISQITSTMISLVSPKKSFKN